MKGPPFDFHIMPEIREEEEEPLTREQRQEQVITNA
jgi:hypothetical protein